MSLDPLIKQLTSCLIHQTSQKAQHLSHQLTEQTTLTIDGYRANSLFLKPYPMHPQAKRQPLDVTLKHCGCCSFLLSSHHKK